MKRHSIALTLALLALLGGCGKKRPPAVLTDPGSRPTAEQPAATATPEPESPVDSGPDIQAIGRDNPSGEDFSVSDPSGEGGPLEDVHFEYDEAILTDQARAILERHALWLQNHRAAKVTVEGHCDERGTVDYNLALGDKRAHAVRDYLVSLGVAAERLGTVSYGKERPLVTGAAEESFAQNRRAHFAVTR
jgi:peptidoglycan-associated lipoprotein